MHRGQFRQYQVAMRQKQIQTELLVSIILVATVLMVFWGIASKPIMLGWACAVILMVGIRSLFIYRGSDVDNPEDIIAWGEFYTVFTALSGVCWGSLGIISSLYNGVDTSQFTMFVLICISLTVFISSQSTPKVITAFVLPTLLINGIWYVTQGTMTIRIMGLAALITAWLMLTASRAMHDLIIKSLGLSTHNTELIHKLVAAREAAEKATKYAGKINNKLKEEISVRLQTEQKLKESNQELGSILDNMQDTVYQLDMDGNITWTTPSVGDMLGYRSSDILGNSMKGYFHEEQDYYSLRSELHANNGVVHNFVTRLLNNRGTPVWVSKNCHYLYNDEREPIGIEGSIRDITSLRETQDELFTEKENAQAILTAIIDGVIRTDQNGFIEYMNETAEKGIGVRLEDCVGKPLMEVFNIVDEKTRKTAPDPSKLSVEQGKSIMLPGYLQLVHQSHDEKISVEVIASPIRDACADITGVVIVFHDVTKSRSLSKMTYLATHDSLTGLYNRREFERRLNQSLDNTRSRDEEHVLCYLDLDNFKVINDTCGHDAGDELLKQLTARLLTIVRDSDSIARLGGDEFGILLNGCTVEFASGLASKIRELVEEYRFVWNNQVFRLGASIGIVSINENSGTISDLMRAADSACYIAKENGGNRIHVYKDDDIELAERHGQMKWVQKLHSVLEENRFQLYFQIIEKLSPAARQNDRIHGEVLLRMRDEHGQIIGPGSFIPAAERYHLMPTIDRWVVENTFRFLAENMGSLYNRLGKCCINLSGQSLSDERLMSFIVDKLHETKIPPGMLCFEITETAVIANMKSASEMILKLREKGCRFALDDFGVGLSSFAYLRNLAVDYLKIDASFVRNIRNNRTDLEMVRAINQIGHTMNVLTIAEFVEDEATLESIRNIGVDYAQGYATHQPLPIENALLQEARGNQGVHHRNRKVANLQVS